MGSPHDADLLPAPSAFHLQLYVDASMTGEIAPNCDMVSAASPALVSGQALASVNRA